MLLRSDSGFAREAEDALAEDVAHDVRRAAHDGVAGAVGKALGDVIPEKAKELGEKYDVPYFYDFADMNYTFEPDVISILTPSGSHTNHILQRYGYDNDHDNES